jgi:hypothetical protein
MHSPDPPKRRSPARSERESKSSRTLRYRVRIKYADGQVGGQLEMQVDCAKRTRGQLPDPRMRETYNGTLAREEVKIVCLVAAQENR